MNPISRAEAEIQQILRDLEHETGQVVEGIDIRSIETRNVEDVRPQLLRRVQIQMYQVPGSNWGGDDA